MKPTSADRRLTLTELAADSGVAPRTIRYYIARGLLEGPLERGRKAAYGERHLEKLRKIRELQEQGLALAEIARVLDGGEGGSLPEPVVVETYQVAPDVAVHVRAGRSPWRKRLIREALRELARRLAQPEEGDKPY